MTKFIELFNPIRTESVTHIEFTVGPLLKDNWIQKQKFNTRDEHNERDESL